MDERDPASIAVDSLDVGLAIVDPAGKITWANASWLDAVTRQGTLQEGKGLGTVADLSAGARGAAAAAIERGIRSVIEGDSAYFELEYRAPNQPPRRFVLTATQLRSESQGAVVTHRELRSADDRRAPVIGGVRAAEMAAPVDRLTPREMQILRLLARGLPNRDIARELKIEYTTVRGYVQTIIQKFGASSRLECVAKAYRLGMVE